MNITPGAYVRITYQGEETTARGNTIKLFDVETKKGARIDQVTGDISGT